MMDSYIKLAKEAVESYIKTGQEIVPPTDLPKNLFSRRAGAFVSIHKKNGELRGCIGTYLPTQPSICQEIITNAILAASQDPRFEPIQEEELDNLEYSIDILSSPKPIPNSQLSYLNPKIQGLIVSAPDGRRGLLLPDLDGVDTLEQQFQICCQKGGINPKEKVNLETFTVERHK